MFEGDFANLYTVLDQDTMAQLGQPGHSMSLRGGDGRLCLALDLSDAQHISSHVQHKVYYGLYTRTDDLSTSLIYNILNKRTAFVVVGE